MHYIETDLFRAPDFALLGQEQADKRVGFADWLIGKVKPLSAEGFAVGDSVEEDYGCGFWVEFGKTPFWVALSYVGDEETAQEEGPVSWVVQVAYDPGLNLLKRLFHRPDQDARRKLESRVEAALTEEAGIRLMTEAEWLAQADD